MGVRRSLCTSPLFPEEAKSSFGLRVSRLRIEIGFPQSTDRPGVPLEVEAALGYF